MISRCMKMMPFRYVAGGVTRPTGTTVYWLSHSIVGGVHDGHAGRASAGSGAFPSLAAAVRRAARLSGRTLRTGLGVEVSAGAGGVDLLQAAGGLGAVEADPQAGPASHDDPQPAAPQPGVAYAQFPQVRFSMDAPCLHCPISRPVMARGAGRVADGQGVPPLWDERCAIWSKKAGLREAEMPQVPVGKE